MTASPRSMCLDFPLSYIDTAIPGNITSTKIADDAAALGVTRVYVETAAPSALSTYRTVLESLRSKLAAKSPTIEMWAMIVEGASDTTPFYTAATKALTARLLSRTTTGAGASLPMFGGIYLNLETWGPLERNWANLLSPTSTQWTEYYSIITNACGELRTAYPLDSSSTSAPIPSVALHCPVWGSNCLPQGQGGSSMADLLWPWIDRAIIAVDESWTTASNTESFAVTALNKIEAFGGSSRPYTSELRDCPTAAQAASASAPTTDSGVNSLEDTVYTYFKTSPNVKAKLDRCCVFAYDKGYTVSTKKYFGV